MIFMNLRKNLVVFVVVLLFLTMQSPIVYADDSSENKNGKEMPRVFTYYYDLVNKRELVVLMMHHMVDKPYDNFAISENKLREVIETLGQNGYRTVTVKEIVDFVHKGNSIPRRCAILTFDDGYLSNYEKAYPIIKEYNGHAVFFVVGVLAGKTKYKETDVDIIPHFSWEQAKEMSDSGNIEIQSHTYDLHQYTRFEENKIGRETMLPLRTDTEEGYRNVIINDLREFNKHYRTALGKDAIALSYPKGGYTPELVDILHNEGIKVTFSSDAGFNTLVYGSEETLYNLKRFNITEDTDIQELLDTNEKKENKFVKKVK